MAYRKFKADYLFTGSQLLDNNNVLVTAADGTIDAIIPSAGAGDGVEKLQGILSPGFVNCHCHLELSHLKGLIPEGTGLVNFVYTVLSQRQFPEEKIYQAIADAEEEMMANGIVAVGDVCNNNHSLAQKEQQRLIYYNFIEVSGWMPELAKARFDRSKIIYDEFNRSAGPDLSNEDGLGRTAFAPHAPYSVSDKLWELIGPYFLNKTTTMHNQECPFEDELFRTGTGDFRRLYELMNIDNGLFRPTGKSSLQSCLPKLKQAKKLILVHNTFTGEEDLQYCQSFDQQGDPAWQLHFCICINANKYIEKALPPIDLLRKYDCDIVLGTDSLASNLQLDILAEIKTISHHFPAIPLEELLRWATINGAKALQIDDVAGSFDPGKKPGIILIENLDGQHITNQTLTKRVI